MGFFNTRLGYKVVGRASFRRKQAAEAMGEYRPNVLVPYMVGGLVPGALLAKHLDITDVRPAGIDRNCDARVISYDIAGV